MIALVPACKRSYYTSEIKSNSNQKANPEDIAPPQIASFSGAKQNSIFKTIVAQTGDGSCRQNSPDPQARLITAQEYVSSVQMAFDTKLPTSIYDTLPAETVVLGYNNLRDFNVVSPEKLQAFLGAGKSVVSHLQQNGISKNIVSCSNGDSKRCVSNWLQSKLPLLWKQKISDTDLQREVDLFAKYGGDEKGFGSLVERLLLSPFHLFQKRLNEGNSLSSHEVASWISEVFWGAPMSRDLIQDIEAGRFDTKAGIKKSIQTMVNDDRFYDSNLNGFLNIFFD